MTEIGKHAPGLKGFPTPNTAAGTIAYLLLYFPDQEWAQYALGALRALEAGYNWYEAGDVLPDDAAEAFRVIDEQAPFNKLPSCSLPTGQQLTRIDPATGHIQTVDSDGNWQDDPDIPATPERPPDTPEDQRCLAAENCANALQILYESLSDSFNAGLTEAEAIAALVTAVGAVLGVVFAFPLEALIAVAGVLFSVVYAVVQFITADLWTEDFTAVLVCYLYNCSSVSANVVTFDFNCVIDALAAQTSAESLTGEQLRLFGQLYYLLNWIGVDGLNAAGAATAITVANCECPWCYEFDFSLGELGWVSRGGASVYLDGKWQGIHVDGATECSIKLEFTIGDAFVTSVTPTYSADDSADGGFRGVYFNDSATIPPGAATNLSGGSGVFTTTVSYMNNTGYIGMNVDTHGHESTNTITKVVVRGTGTNPFGDDNCT